VKARNIWLALGVMRGQNFKGDCPVGFLDLYDDRGWSLGRLSLLRFRDASAHTDLPV